METKKGREVGTAERKLNEQVHDKCLINADYYYCQAFNSSTPPLERRSTVLLI